jgi:MYXO-CTERM domain-containing protein
VYDPASGSWTATGSLAGQRYLHTATLLPSGKVLVVGGFGLAGRLASAELYDPANGTWSATGSLATARYLHTATLLPSGKVLVTGGLDGTPQQNLLSSAELYDPASGTWSATNALATARYNHSATLLPSGKVLVAGGYGASYLASSELYDPANGTWSSTGSLTTARSQHTATELSSGKVLVVGGYAGSGVLGTAELYDPANGTWGATGSLATARSRHTATLLDSGAVLVAGGYGADYVTSAETFAPASESWSSAGALATARVWHTATLLPSKKVLVAGGWGSLGYLASVELYLPAPNSPPVAASQSVSVNEDSSVAITLSATDADGDGLGYAVLTQPAHGTLTGGGVNLTYTPAADYNGPDSFTFKAHDGVVDSAPAAVSITVTPVNDPPVVQAQGLTLAEDASASITLAGTDIDGDTLTYAILTQPAHGTLAGGGVNLTYTPAADYNGPDGFTFKANDGTVDSNVATVSITVTPVNDPPVAHAQAVSTAEDTSADILLTASDVDGDALTYAVVTPPAHGALTVNGASVTYVPAARYSGSDSFTFIANDGSVDSAPATVSLTVTQAPAAGGCSCGPGAEVAPLGALLVAMLGLRRRRRAR